MAYNILMLQHKIVGFYSLKIPKKVFADDPNGSISIKINGSSNDNVESLRKKLQLFKQFYKNKAIDYYSINISPDPQTKLLTGEADIKYKGEYLTQLPKFNDKINAFIKKNNLSNTSSNVNNFLNWFSFDISLYLYGGSDHKQVNRESQQIKNLMQKSPIFSLVVADIAKPEKQLSFDINKIKAESVGITRSDILSSLSSYYGGSQLSKYFSISGLSVPVRMQINKSGLTDIKSLEQIQIQNEAKNKIYPITEFVNIKLTAKPTKITTFNNQPSVVFMINLNKGYNMGDAINYINKLIKLHSPNMQFKYTGGAQTYLKGNAETIWIAILGITCVYFLLTILFKNLIDPFIIMLTVPFSVIGGALSLYIIGGSINIYSSLGLITLVGLITKHGVLIVQFANAELKKGSHIRDAVLLATHHRFRPIIMTTLAMVLGALPLIFGSGLMYMSRANLGITIIGGLIIGTIFSLFIVPLVYTLVKKSEHYDY
jgi:multidrug efflux pump